MPAMRPVVAVPSRLDERSFDELAAQVAPVEGSAVVDARHLRWVDPYGMLGLLAAGAVLASRGARPTLYLPQAAEVLSYLSRMGFWAEAERVYELSASPPAPSAVASRRSPVLLEITPVRDHRDVHRVIAEVHERAATILRERLHYTPLESAGFSLVLSEVCQNIIEHAGAEGWVGIQSYRWAQRLGRQVVVIAVMDLGVGFRRSLEREHAARYGERWSDATALEAAFIHGASRFRDPGRGQGLKQIRAQVGRWGGKISIRSGTARIADVPDWDDAPPLETNLPPFPGAQILVVIPEKANGGAKSP